LKEIFYSGKTFQLSQTPAYPERFGPKVPEGQAF